MASTEIDSRELFVDVYQSFIKRHLQYYGYYTGKSYSRRRVAALEGLPNQDGQGSSSDEETRGVMSSDEENKAATRDEKREFSIIDPARLVKLKQPRSLYPNALGQRQPPLWPHELQVLPGRVEHISYVPDKPEPLYIPTGNETCPPIRSLVCGRTVFDYSPCLDPFFRVSRIAGSTEGVSSDVCVKLTSPDDATLLFESRFESGNLQKAVQLDSTVYELWLRTDLYTKKHTQWYYYRVSNTRANRVYRFTIVNFYKPDSLYNNGMKPLFYSERLAKEKGIGWIRNGENIRYYRANLLMPDTLDDSLRHCADRQHYALTWTCEFPYDHDVVYFAHCYPYTYSDLQQYLLQIHDDPEKSKICKQRLLCNSLANNFVYLLTVTAPSQSPEEAKRKKVVVLTSRVHPGESNASWMMKGFLDYLLSDEPDAKVLRQHFIFKIIPMLNPDGVIVGNYRCGLAGRDLNRQYKHPLKSDFPSVHAAKQLVERLIEQDYKIVLYCDLHGHSRKQCVFIYGCENALNPSRRLRERVFPVMMSRNAPDYFSFESCKFKVEKSKEGTGRIVMWTLGIMNSYTMEATFCGSNLGNKRGYHFTSRDFEKIGHDFLDTILDYCDPSKAKTQNVLLFLEDRVRSEIMQRLRTLALANEELAQIHLDNLNLEEMQALAYQYETASDSRDLGDTDSSAESDSVPVRLKVLADRGDQDRGRSGNASGVRRRKTRQERNQMRQALRVEQTAVTVVGKGESDAAADAAGEPRGDRIPSGLLARKQSAPVQRKVLSMSTVGVKPVKRPEADELASATARKSSSVGVNNSYSHVKSRIGSAVPSVQTNADDQLTEKTGADPTTAARPPSFQRPFKSAVSRQRAGSASSPAIVTLAAEEVDPRLGGYYNRNFALISPSVAALHNAKRVSTADEERSSQRQVGEAFDTGLNDLISEGLLQAAAIRGDVYTRNFQAEIVDWWLKERASQAPSVTGSTSATHDAPSAARSASENCTQEPILMRIASAKDFTTRLKSASDHKASRSILSSKSPQLRVAKGADDYAAENLQLAIANGRMPDTAQVSMLSTLSISSRLSSGVDAYVNYDTESVSTDASAQQSEPVQPAHVDHVAFESKPESVVHQPVVASAPVKNDRPTTGEPREPEKYESNVMRVPPASSTVTVVHSHMPNALGEAQQAALAREEYNTARDSRNYRMAYRKPPKTSQRHETGTVYHVPVASEYNSLEHTESLQIQSTKLVLDRLKANNFASNSKPSDYVEHNEVPGYRIASEQLQSQRSDKKATLPKPRTRGTEVTLSHTNDRDRLESDSTKKSNLQQQETAELVAAEIGLERSTSSVVPVISMKNSDKDGKVRFALLHTEPESTSTTAREPITTRSQMSAVRRAPHAEDSEREKQEKVSEPVEFTADMWNVNSSVVPSHKLARSKRISFDGVDDVERSKPSTTRQQLAMAKASVIVSSNLNCTHQQRLLPSRPTKKQ